MQVHPLFPIGGVIAALLLVSLAQGDNPGRLHFLGAAYNEGPPQGQTHDHFNYAPDNLSDLLAAQGKNFFSEVRVASLKGDVATRPAVMAQMERLQREARANDLRNLEQENWTVKNVLPGFLSRMSTGNVEFVARSVEYGPHEKWMSLLRNTNRRFDAMGISLAAWRQGENLTTNLTEKAHAGCAIRLA